MDADPIDRDNAEARTQRSGRKPRLNREAWLQGALDVMAEAGVERVKVEPLARRLKVTKGSFYWHFKDRRDLLDSLLTWWEEQAGANLVNTIEGQGGAPDERIWRLIERLTLGAGDAHDPAMRAWAREDASAAGCLERVDRLRLEYLESLFTQLGFDRDQAMARARLVHFYQVGDETVGLKDSFGTRLALAIARHKLLIEGP